MIVHDEIFGDVQISEPVLVDLINSAPIQRLRGIDQAGYPAPFFPHCAPHNRFDHSLGVCLVLRHYGASLEEQIAGLIHDVSHTAFSHCADYIFGTTDAGKTQSYQDDTFEAFVRKSAIPEILQQHDIDIERILNDSLFPLKEQPLPDLCADRIDYSFRAALATRHYTPEQTKDLLKTLLSNGTQWFFTTALAARQYAELFAHLNATLWSGVGSALMFRAVGDCLKYATNRRYVHPEDFYTTDDDIIKTIVTHSATDPTLQRLFDRMNTCPTTPSFDPTSEPLFCKSRAVDPLCVHEGKLVRLSKADPSWAPILLQESAPKVYHVCFET